MEDTNKNILIIDDNLTICLMLKSWLVKKNYGVRTATSVTEAKQKVKEHAFDLILTDIRMPEMDGFSFLSWVKKYDSDILVIMMTGYADIESAVESMKSGAVDYISKPIEPEQLFKKIEEAFSLQENILKQNRFQDDFVKFPTEEYQKLYRDLELTAEHNMHRLIIGDRGTGKQSAAKYIYQKGIHLTKPMVVFDADKLPETGSSRNGESLSPLMQKYHEAKGGLLYVRQVAGLNSFLQDELLNILTRQTRNEDFTQIIMSTDLCKVELQRRLIPKFYQLIIKDAVELPALKGKKEVITFFSGHFLRFANSILDKQITGIEQTVLDELIRYEWPGNIQELKNCIIKAVLMTEEDTIQSSILTQLLNNGKRVVSPALTFSPIQGLRKENYEKEKIMEALELAKGNKTMAASILNIDRKTLYNKIKLYNVPIH